MTMRSEWAGKIVELVQGDITAQRVDAIVNAANSRLAGGGGVDGAIHRAGGPEIMAETRQKYPSGCETGNAVISSAGRLLAQYVIHAVGPVWRGGGKGEEALLASAHRKSLALAAQHDCRSLAFPALSTGAYGYPIDLASRIALRQTIDYLRSSELPGEVRFVLFSEDAYGAFAAALEELTSDLP